MKIELVNFVDNFRIRKNENGTGVISCMAGVVTLNETGFDQFIALNNNATFEGAVDDLFAMYQADREVLANDLKETIKKINDYEIEHKSIRYEE